MFDSLKYKLSGGALYYAIVVLLLLSLISSGFILLNRLWFQENTLFLKNMELNDRLDSAQEWIKIQPGLVRTGETKQLNLFDDSSVVMVASETWGLLRLIRYTARWNSLTIKRTALYSELSNDARALYLADKNKFLSLIGKSIIKGDCSLPALGIRAGEMDGGTFTGKTMVDGKIYQSEKYIPPVSYDLLDSWRGYWDKKFRPSDSIVSANDLSRHPVYAVSFNSPAKVINYPKSAVLQNTSLSGNIIVVATDTITIQPSAQLNDVLVFANTIIVANNVKGSFQLFARRHISIGDQCVLQYPSFSICFAQEKTAKITIGKKSAVWGGILIDSETENTGSNRLEMGEDCRLTGTVYVNGEVGFSGRIDGSLYCNGFYHETPRAYYENFLKDAFIDLNSREARFGSFAVDGMQEELKFVKLCL